MEMIKTYNPKDFEERIYKFWEEGGFFTPRIEPDRKPFTIVIPPPNVTGQLHMGHALNNTLQDILIRWKRMQGIPTLWLPGTDHAGIATQIKVESELAKEGLSRYDLGREAFIEKVWQWKQQYGNIIINQLKRLGASCDWTRERFTMDERCSKAVREVFVRLYEKGLIYRGYRIINWCPRCRTALSDIEVEYEEKKSSLWYIKYPIKESNEYVVVATTRPETMLGDTAVAVNPGDERYQHLIGKTVILPLMNREIPIIADDYVDPEFGTGAVKVTPAHDPNDYEIGERHNLEKINIMNEDGTLNQNAGIYNGLDRYEARKRIVEDLKRLGLLIKIEEHNHSVGQCSRCDTVVEPIISRQWFVKMKPLAQPAIDVVKEGKIKFVPERFSKIYINWMENIKDWCISRQLWWGHRIPAWYCECGEVIVSRKVPEKCHRCGKTDLEQDPDVLDTWFSSALWPFSTLGWPEKTEDLEYFYPTSVLVTGYDIIPFWVARMIFTALEFMKEIPFEYVLINGIVRDDQGRKMSKSLGNGIDPLEIIDSYGADSLRFTLVTGNSPGNDMRFYYDRVEASRNFANKIWNAARFLIMNLNRDNIKEIDAVELTLVDKWILSRLNRIVKEVTENLEKFELGIAAQKLYDFIWSEFCDWYIEFSKLRLYSDDEDIKINAQSVLVYVLDKILKLLHPFMPFITEEIWQNLPKKEKSLMISEWPEYSEKLQDEMAERKVSVLMDVIKSIRNIKAEVNATSSKPKVMIFVEAEEMRDLIINGKEYILRLSGSSELEFVKNREELPKNSVSAVLPDAEIFVPLGELIDIEKELVRLYAEKDKIEKEIERAKMKLANQEFVSKAPESIVNKEREKLVMYQDMLEKLVSRIENLK